MPVTSQLLSELKSRRVGYARIDRDLTIREIGGCEALWGDVRGKPLTVPLPEISGMHQAIVESIASGDEIALPLLNRPQPGPVTCLDVVVQPDARVPGAAIVWLFDMTELRHAARAHARAMTAFNQARGSDEADRT